MKIEKGMVFKGNINGATIRIKSADEKMVVFEDLEKGTFHTYGRKAFEHCNLTKIQ